MACYIENIIIKLNIVLIIKITPDVLSLACCDELINVCLSSQVP